MNTRPRTAGEALQALRDGNARFVDGDRCIDTYLSHTKLDEHLEGQAPYAIVLGCSDSRVPVEIIFDVGLGDLFVIRVAGNIVAPSIVGSIELAAEKFGPRLVVVLGHTGCGAVGLAVEAFRNQDATLSGNVNSIIESISPALDDIVGADGDRDGLAADAVRANVRASVSNLRHGSAALERLICDEGLLVVGAEYSLETGAVQFFDGMPDTG